MVKRKYWFRLLLGMILGLVFLSADGFCNIINYGNVQTRVVVTMKDGRRASAMLNPSDSIPLPDDAASVKVDSLGNERGDEEINVWINLPDGSHGEIHDYGGIYVVPDITQREGMTTARGF